VPLPDAKPPFTAEIALKLDAPLTGKPDENLELTWTDGQPSAFTKDPFLLTVDVEKAKIVGLKTTPAPRPRCIIQRPRRRLNQAGQAICLPCSTTPRTLASQGTEARSPTALSGPPCDRL